MLLRLVAGFAVSGKALEAVHAAEGYQIQATPEAGASRRPTA